MLVIVVMICSAAEPKCDADTARAYQRFAAPPGFVVCGPALVAPVVNSAVATDDREYIRMRCEWIGRR